jgi:hypothetical protein
MNAKGQTVSSITQKEGKRRFKREEEQEQEEEERKKKQFLAGKLEHRPIDSTDLH